MRTDENNNPTAMTTDIAKLGGLVESLEYAQGQPFTVLGSNGVSVVYHTAKLLLNPIELTVRVIDTIGFYTHAGGQRWIYIAIPKFIWDVLTRDQKVQVIGFMYQREGGVTMRSLFPTVA